MFETELKNYYIEEMDGEEYLELIKEESKRALENGRDFLIYGMRL